MRWVIGISVMVVFAAALSVGAQPTRPAGPANWVVVPGHAIGDIQLGMSQQQVLNRLGMPDEISNDRTSDGGLNVYWVYPMGDRSVFVVSWTKRQGEAGGVDFLFTDHNRYVTSKGVALGNSTFRDLLTEYGAPDRMSGLGRGAVMFYYEGQGIRFRIEGEAGRVSAITIVPRK
ncbi:MAG: hypothetical protein HY355_03340 [Armatimonadetes bacterium]|nr:hypothetical protein [Armatimonadota bacterium]